MNFENSPWKKESRPYTKGHFTKVYSNKGGQLQNFSGILSAVYILYVVIKGMNKVFFTILKSFWKYT